MAIAIGDRILTLENAIYSVISPEGCASIMWRDATKKDLAAEAMQITAKDCLQFGVIDTIVPEPEGGAHNDPEAAAAMLDQALQEHLGQLKQLSGCQLADARYAKFRNMAQFFTE